MYGNHRSYPPLEQYCIFQDLGAAANGEGDQPSAKADGPNVSDALQEELEKNAIYSPGDPTAKQTYSGKVSH